MGSIGYSINEVGGALKRCWTAYQIAAFCENDEEEKAIKYAREYGAFSGSSEYSSRHFQT
jgi:hypothetical protein